MRENYYNEMIKRNIGIFTPEEQNKIKGMTIGIAGLGGYDCCFINIRKG